MTHAHLAYIAHRDPSQILEGLLTWLSKDSRRIGAS